MGTREWMLTIAVIAVPLAIAVIVTLWTLEQARYRPKRKRPPGIRRDDALSETLSSPREPEPTGHVETTGPTT